MVKTIELDCAPGQGNPGLLIAGVIEGTGLPTIEPRSKLFGCWTWDYCDITDDVWEAANPTVRERINALGDAGKIRFGSW